MPAITTQAIVLRRVDYRENDRMLSLLTPLYGRVDALCRGCRRPTSPLMSCSEWFALGEYVLFSGKGRQTVTSCQLTDTFYPIREDYARLSHATYLINLTEAAAQPGQRSVELFTLLARSLTRIAYTDKPLATVTAGFLLHFAAISGYQPSLDACARCGAPVDSARLFDLAEGGVLCRDCASSLTAAAPLALGHLDWLRQVLKAGIDKYPLADENPPLTLLEKYVEMRMEKKVRRAPLPTEE